MSLQTHKNFDHIWNTNDTIFNEIWEISVPSLKVYNAKTLTLKKR